MVSLRFFNVYGPRQSLSNPYTGVCAIFLSRIKNNKPPVIYEDGFQTRDFIWVGDIVRACILCMENEKANFQIFNVGTGKPVSIRKIARTLAELLNKKIKPEITYRFRKGDIRHCYADIKKIKKLVGFTPQVTLKEGMSKLINWAKRTKSVDKFSYAERKLEEKGLVK